MSDFSELMSEKFKGSSKEVSVDLIKKSKVKNSIMRLIDENLKTGDELIFEVSPQELPYVLLAVDEDPIKSMVTVEQISEVLFKISLINIDLGL